MIEAVSSQAELLTDVLKDVAARFRGGFSPLVVFDIDDTLFSTAKRHLRILRELSQEQVWAAALGDIKEASLRYSIVDTAKACGISQPPQLGAIREFWVARFFKNDYLLEDEPLPGASAFCRDLKEGGATVVYMTGRDETMREGTLKALAGRGFPPPDSLILKPRFDTPDLEYKTESIERLRALGSVTAAFENEPAHINLFQAAFAQSRHFLVGDKHSGKAVAPHPSVIRIRDFRRFDIMPVQ